MTPRRRRRLASALRLLAVALFAFALVLRPVVDSLGEMHELAHGGHGHMAPSAPDIAPADATPKAAAKEGKQASTLHTLLNFAHCCGTTVATLPDVGFAPGPALDTDAPAAREHVAGGRTRLINPFRPPIPV